MRLSIVFALILLLSVITGCAAKTQYSTQKIDGFSYVEGSLIYINEDLKNPLVGRLVYYGPGIYFLKIQYENYYRGLRKSYTFLNGEKLNTFVSENSLLLGSSSGGRLDIRLNQQQLELATNGNFRVKNIDYTGHTVDIEVPVNYARQFMEKVCQVDPTHERESLKIELAKR